MELASFQPSLA